MITGVLLLKTRILHQRANRKSVSLYSKTQAWTSADSFWKELCVICRSMMQKEGGGGPTFSEPAFTESLWWSNSGHLKREHVLDNWSQHTSKCTSCQKVSNLMTTSSDLPITCTLGEWFNQVIKILISKVSAPWGFYCTWSCIPISLCLPAMHVHWKCHSRWKGHSQQILV